MSRDVRRERLSHLYLTYQITKLPTEPGANGRRMLESAAHSMDRRKRDLYDLLA